jgi:guanylate kinase
MKGLLAIISGPSGAGKTTIVKHLLDSGLKLEFSVSATTRPIRSNEIDGRDYYFLTTEGFRSKIARDEFVEWEEVYKDHFYGTLRTEIERIWANGNHVLFDVDVKGALNLKKQYLEQSISVFVMPPSISVLENRLVTRGTDSPQKIRMRIERAAEEMKLSSGFDHIVTNDNLEQAKNKAYTIVSTFINQ